MGGFELALMILRIDGFELVPLTLCVELQTRERLLYIRDGCDIVRTNTDNTTNPVTTLFFVFRSLIL